jgi:regulator of protease activity HflC (stomatin/prohibitin superfamily)
MSTSLTAKFDKRREAEMTVERLVQQFNIERTDVFVAAEGDENTAGVEEAGSDTKAGAPSPEDRDDAELTGRVVVSVDIEDDDLAGEVRSAFAEFHAAEVEKD